MFVKIKLDDRDRATCIYYCEKEVNGYVSALTKGKKERLGWL